VSSAAFKPTRDGSVSVDLEQLLMADGLPLLTMYPAIDQAVAAAAVGVDRVRQAGLEPTHDPDPRNWYHGAIRGNFTGKISRDLARDIEFLVPIDQEAAAHYHPAGA
jgi:hypothetical protein